MNVLVLTAAYPAPSEPGRAIFIENLTRHQLAVASGELTVVAPRVAAGDPLAEVREGVRVRRFPYAGGGKRLKEIARPSPFLLASYAASVFFCLRRELRRQSVDCILCHWVLPTGPPAALASGRQRKPLVVVAHGSDVNRYARRSRLANRLARMTLRRAARVLAVSDCLRQRLIEDFGVPAAKVVHLPMGVDSAVFRRRSRTLQDEVMQRSETRRALGLDPELPTMLFVGDLTEDKGVGDLLAAWQGLQRRNLRTQLCLVGDGPLKKRPLENLGVNGSTVAPRARYVGRVTPVELACWYRAADLLVLPSYSEGSPVCVMEALSCGVPVVASRVGGIPELVEEGRTGRLVPAGDVEALTATLAAVLETPGELGLLRRGLQEMPAERFSVARRAEALAGVLEEVCRGA